jgi:3-oxoacyl-[acyl-carrier-protein] synthase II
MVDPQTQDIVITGVGVVSPVGIGREAFWRSLVNRNSGIARFSNHPMGDFPIQFGGELKDFDPKAYVKPRKAIKLMCREIQTGYAAADLAVKDAAIDTTQVESERFGVVFGSEMLYGDPAELAEVHENSTRNGVCDLQLFGERFSHDMFPLWMLNFLPNMPACHVGICHQAFAANNSIVLGDASSLLAISEAVSVIRRNWADVMICGGTGSRINITHRVHITREGLSTREKDPATAARPFDDSSDGEVVGEGAGAIVIETRQHAEARGATPLAKILAYSSTYGEFGLGSDGATRAAIQRSIRTVLDRAACDKSEIDHVNAHGIGRPVRDRQEAQAIHAELKGVPVTALKSYFGNLGAGSGTVEAVASILAFAAGHVPGALNHAQTDPDCPIDVVPPQGKPCDRPLALLLNQSTTGQAAAVVIGRP